MAVTAPVPGVSFSNLARLFSSPQQAGADAAKDKPAGTPDVVVFSSASMRVLSDLASAGLRQLASLLPALQQAVEAPNPVPLGHLAKAANAAARQIDEGHEALLAEGPDRVASSLQGRPASAPADAPDGAKQTLRALARDIGADATFDEADELTEPNEAEQGRAPARADRHALEIYDAPARHAGDDRPTTPVQLKTLSADPEAEAAHAKQALHEAAHENSAEPPPDARTRETLRTVARQIGDAAGRPLPHTAAQPGDNPIQRWLTEAKHVLRTTGDALDRAEAQVRPLTPDAAALAQNPAAWALAEIVAAQNQVALAYSNLMNSRAAHRPDAASALTGGRSPLIDQLAGATSLLGLILLLGMLWLADGLWWIASGCGALATAGYWVWRFTRAAPGLRLDVKR